MAHYVEPMDIDDLESDFDNKENSLHHNNVIPRTLACTEKGYEELDVSELNMKLRYSVSPTSSLMSKSYTTNCDNRTFDLGNASLNNTNINENSTLTRSLNSAINKNNGALKSIKPLPLQTLSTDQYVDSNGNPSALRSFDCAHTPNNNNLTVNVLGKNEIDENLSVLSSSSSTAHTPEAITPTKDLKNESDSSIIRGLKSVLNLFRPSQSPIPPAEDVNIGTDQDVLSSDNFSLKGEVDNLTKQVNLASTPIAAHKNKDVNSSKRNSPHKDSIVFSDDLEKELQWNNETTIIFSQEKIPIHKLFLQQTKPGASANQGENDRLQEKLNATEYMDISYNESTLQNKTTDVLTDNNPNINETNVAIESDSEFVDCETSLSKPETGSEDKNITSDNKFVLQANNINMVTDEINKNITDKKLNATTESLDTTVSVKSGDISFEVMDSAKEAINVQSSEDIFERLETIVNSNIIVPEATNNIDIITKAPIEVVQTINIESPKLVTHLSDNQSDIRNIEIKENVILEDNKLDSQKLVSTNVIHIKNISPLNTSHINDVSTVDISQNVEAVSSSVIRVVDDNLNNNIIVSNSVIPNDVPLPADVPLPDDDLDSLVTVTVAPLDVKTDITNSEFQNPNILTETHLDKVLNEIQHENNIINSTPPEVQLSTNVAKDINKTIHDNQLEYNIDTYKVSDVNPNLIEVVKEEIMNKTQNVQPMSVSFVDKATINKIVDTTSATSVEIITDNTNAQDVALGSQVQGEGTEQSISNNINNENKMFKDICCIPEVGDVAVDIMKENIVETVNSDNKNVNPMLSTNDIISEESIKSDQQEIPEIATSISAQEDNGYMVSEKIETNITNFTSQGEVIINKVLDKINSDITTCIESGCKHNETLNVTVVDSNSDLSDKIEIISDEVTVPDNTNVMITESVKDKVNEDILNKQTDISPTADLTSNNIAAKDTEITIITTEDKLTDNELNIAHETEIEQESTLPTNNIVAQTDEVALDATMIVVNEDKSALPVEITADNLNINCQLKSIHEADTIHSNIINDKVINEKEKQTEDERDPISEEIIISENNSPYVSVIADTEHSTETQSIDKFEEIDNPFATKSDIAKSPPIASKGYNFNFDELDDPFATKSKIRMSPPPTSPNQSFNEDSKMAEKVEISKKVNNRNRRKSQPERKKPVNVVKNNLNSTFGCDKTDSVLEKSIEKIENSNRTQVKDVNENEQREDYEPIVRDTEKTPVDDTIPSLRARETEVIKPEYTEAYECEKSISEETYRSQLIAESVDSKNGKDNDELKCKVKETVTNDNNNTSSSEQSTYYSAATSSSEGIERKNVFNLPEIDDKNFNPFSTKLKIRQSPPSNLEIDDQFLTKSKILSSPESSVISPENDVNSTVIVNTPKEFTETIVDVNKEDKDVTVREIYPGNDVTIDDPFFEAEALNIDKDSSFVGESTSKVKFNGLPTQEIDENDAAELFIDAQAFEFLMNQNKSNEVADSGKESLFLKFDPLFAGRVTSDGVVAALSKIQRRQSTPKHSKPSQKDLMTSPVAGSSKMDVTQEVTKNNIFEESNEDLNATVSKPMMIVPPAVNPVITPRNKSTTPSRLNRRSLTFTSPAIAVIDRLLSLSSNDSLMGHDITMTQASREQNEADLALTQLRELLAEKEIHVHQLRVESKELKDRLATMESKMRTLEMENEGKLKKINELNEKIVENTKVNRNMAVVVEEYERTIASLIAEADHDKKRNAEERNQLIKDRDEQTAHLASMEVSFNDLHSKYEKSKQLILEFKAREDSYNKSLQEFKENLTKMQTNYDLLKQHATSKLNHANQELEKLNRTHEAEVLKLNAMIKRKELHITSLEETLAQKTKANEELTAICDELINKVG